MNKFKRKDQVPLCACGCGNFVTRKQGSSFLWNKYIIGHNRKNKNQSDKTKRKISISKMGHIITKETKKKMSEARQNMSDEAKDRCSHKGIPHTIEHNNRVAISLMKCRVDGYCDAWSDNEFKKDCLKDFCEICGIKRKKVKDKNGRLYSNLLLHHEDFNPKNCCLDNLQTLCISCHVTLHNDERKRTRK